jgi:type VI secretion system secreted protein VgrG
LPDTYGDAPHASIARKFDMPENAYFLKLTSPVEELQISHLAGTEQLGRLFAYDLQLESTDFNIDAKDLLGAPLAVELAPFDAEGRWFHGITTSFHYVGEGSRRALYQATIRPWLWLLTRRGTCRIFQNKTAPEIIEAVLKDAGFTDFQMSLDGSYATREYCVQYNESDFNFVSRLMEEEGIYYFFIHEETKHTLKIVDAASPHPATALGSLRYAPGRTIPDQAIGSWSNGRHFQTGKVALNDYNFQTPATNLLTRASKQREHAGANQLELYSYPGPYIVSGDGDHLANIRLAEHQAEHNRSQGSGPIGSLVCGETFELTDHCRDDQNGKYIAVATTYDVESNIAGESGDGGENSCQCAFEAMPIAEVYRSASITPKPLIQGPQTALVVGPSGKEIWTDKYGRVKLHFYWDLLSKKDENSSCWVRVSQTWAGANWGAMHIPRIGQEVIVEFLGGDPDRPIISGRVYNAAVMPPYALPDNQTQSGIISRSTPEGDEQTFNELRFEDKKDSEQVYFHAEKDFSRVVENNDVLKVGFSKKDKGNQTIEVFNNQTVTIGCKDAEDGSQTATIWKNRTETIKEGDDSLQIEKGKRTVLLDKGDDLHHIKTGKREALIDTGNELVTVKTGDQIIKVTAGSSKLEAGTAIELVVGGSSIKIEASGITIKAPKISIEASAKLSIKGSVGEVSSSGVLNLKGSMVNIN